MKNILLFIVIGIFHFCNAQTWEANNNGDLFVLKKINSTTLLLEATFANGSVCKSTLKRLSSTKINGGYKKEYYSEEIDDGYEGEPWYKIGIVWFIKPAKEGSLISDFGFVVFNDDGDETYDLQLYFFRQ